MSYRLIDGDNVLSISKNTAENLDICISKSGTIHVLDNNTSFTAEIIDVNHVNKTISIILNGRTYSFKIEDELDQLIDKMGLKTVNEQVSKEVKAPMPGLILDIMVEKGQTVQKGDSLLILEAMKMENVIKAEGESVIADILLKTGQTVEKNQVILVFE